MRRTAAIVLSTLLLASSGVIADDGPARHRVDVSQRFQTIDHFGASCFVRPGMMRVAIDGAPLQSHAGLLATAYHEAESGRIVVVYVNSGAAPVALRLEVADGAPRPKTQRAWVTSSAPGDDLRGLVRTAAGETLTVPGRALLTVVLE